MYSLSAEDNGVVPLAGMTRVKVVFSTVVGSGHPPLAQGACSVPMKYHMLCSGLFFA